MLGAKGRRGNLETGGFPIESGPRTEAAPEGGESSWMMETWVRSQVPPGAGVWLW